MATFILLRNCFLKKNNRPVCKKKCPKTQREDSPRLREQKYFRLSASLPKSRKNLMLSQSTDSPRSGVKFVWLRNEHAQCIIQKNPVFLADLDLNLYMKKSIMLGSQVTTILPYRCFSFLGCSQLRMSAGSMFTRSLDSTTQSFSTSYT